MFVAKSTSESPGTGCRTQPNVPVHMGNGAVLGSQVLVALIPPPPLLWAQNSAQPCDRPHKKSSRKTHENRVRDPNVHADFRYTKLFVASDPPPTRGVSTGHSACFTCSRPHHRALAGGASHRLGGIMEYLYSGGPQPFHAVPFVEASTSHLPPGCCGAGGWGGEKQGFMSQKEIERIDRLRTFLSHYEPPPPLIPRVLGV